MEHLEILQCFKVVHVFHFKRRDIRNLIIDNDKIFKDGIIYLRTPLTNSNLIYSNLRCMDQGIFSWPILRQWSHLCMRDQFLLQLRILIFPDNLLSSSSIPQPKSPKTKSRKSPLRMETLSSLSFPTSRRSSLRLTESKGNSDRTNKISVR